jgi:hypothetical protein
MATQTLDALSVTWNDGATSFNAIKMDVTDTASAATSDLLDLQVGSSSVLNVRKDGQVIITSADAAALAVGPNGATNPVLQADASTSSAATGIEVTGKAATAGVAISVISSGTNESLDIDAKGSGTIDLAGNSTGAVTVGSNVVATTTSANALTVGANGTTNPQLNVQCDASSVATGLDIIGNAAGSGVEIAALSSGTNENIKITPKGTGNLDVDGGLIVGHQALSGAGAVDVSSVVTFWTTTSADAGTLADGTVGQIKKIVMVADGGDGTLTPTNFGNGATITFADVGDAVELSFDGTNWWVVGSHGSPAIA